MALSPLPGDKAALMAENSSLSIRCGEAAASLHEPAMADGEGRAAILAQGIKPQFPNGIVSSVSFVSTTNTPRSLAGFVLLALALTPWRSPGSSEKVCSAL